MILNLRKHDTATQVAVRYGELDDLSFIDHWEDVVSGDRNPIRLDAVLFARLAIKRYRAHHRFETYATNVDEIADFTRDNPQAEVANLVLLESDSPEFAPTIGVCHFRRTWCNNLVIDYLSVHPLLARPRDQTPIKGSGTALLYFVSTVAIMTGAALLWGEATQNSCTFYQKAFHLDETKDLIYAPRKNVEEFVHYMQNQYGYPIQ
ncbi:MAG TPA: hypothetical protein VE031_00075 [Chthoniobacterales bacterium]|nr:hypothetical protein [Chthoniobacterales bacterium]